ncbi:MAG: DUF1080 domain-containing protein [Kiritimatiellae bacterium]|nr:DUF1080 domain-containing protein [Kiritimatiellia bacterium]
MLSATLALLFGTVAGAAVETTAALPYVGRWALTIPGGGAGWLGVEKNGPQWKSALLWGGGSVVPTAETKFENGKLFVIRKHNQKKDGKDVTYVETITCTLDGDDMKLTTRTVDETGKEVGKADFTGKRIPPLPPTPDLAKIKFGDPIPLFKKDSIEGWELMEKDAANGWSMKDGVLSNRVKGPDGKNRHCSNIRTTQTFEDFNLKTEVRMLPGGNSGIYLRGIYEIQMADTFGRPVDSHNMCGLYSRITPSEAAEKPAGEWQTVDVTLCDRHLTVILNGKKIIDNKPILGCTGGALTSDEFKPGPIYLQGDHSDVDYRNMVLTPIVK